MRIKGCDAGTKVQELQLEKREPTPGNDPAVLWRIVSATGGPQGTYTIGRVPEGFTQTTRLVEAVRPGEVEDVVVLTAGHFVAPGGRHIGLLRYTIDLGELDEVKWLSLDETPITTVEFDDQVAGIC